MSARLSCLHTLVCAPLVLSLYFLFLFLLLCPTLLFYGLGRDSCKYHTTPPPHQHWSLPLWLGGGVNSHSDHVQWQDLCSLMREEEGSERVTLMDGYFSPSEGPKQAISYPALILCCATRHTSLCVSHWLCTVQDFNKLSSASAWMKYTDIFRLQQPCSNAVHLFVFITCCLIIFFLFCGSSR